MTEQTYAQKLGSSENLSVAAVAALFGATFGIVTAPGLLLEIPYAKNSDGKGQFNIIRKKDHMPKVHWSVIIAHVGASYLLSFLAIMFIAPLLRKRTA